MRTILIFAVFIGAASLCANESIFGEEYIEPLHYPKFFIKADYGMMTNVLVLGSSGIKASLENNLNYVAGFDVGLYKYFNAGAYVGLQPGNDIKRTFETSFLRLGLYAKPMIPIAERFSIYGRMGGGLTVGFLSMLRHLASHGDSDTVEKIKEFYGAQSYSDYAPGVNFSANIGAEVFPFSRFGIGVEWGIRGDYIYAVKGNSLSELIGNVAVVADAPNSFQYIAYSMPITLNLHLIF